MSGGSRVYQTSSPPSQVRELPGGLVLAVVEDTQLPVTGNVNCLQTQSVGQAMLFGLTRRVESPGLVLLGVEMVSLGDTPVSGGTRDQEFTPPR
jgi:hypothetical protein